MIMMKKLLVIATAMVGLTVISACKSTTSVELFRVNENGEVVNIGRGADEGHVIYGHFRDTERYDRAAATVMTPQAAGASSVCYIVVNDGQVNAGVGEGIRLDPCSDITIVNERVITGSLYNIGVYYHEEASGTGIYNLYEFRDGEYKLLLTRPISNELWNSGTDILKRLEDGTIELQFTRPGSDGSIVNETQTLTESAVSSGMALSMPDPETVPAAEPSPDAETGAVQNGEQPAESADAPESTAAETAQPADSNTAAPEAAPAAESNEQKAAE